MTRGGEGNPDRRFAHLGLCPGCGTEIPQTNLVVKYQPAEGWPRIFAECPECVAVVSPQ
jgi:hypothetical protein